MPSLIWNFRLQLYLTAEMQFISWTPRTQQYVKVTYVFHSGLCDIKHKRVDIH